MTDVLAAGLPVADPTESERRVWAAFARASWWTCGPGTRKQTIPAGLKPGTPHAGCGLRWWPRYGWAR